MIKKIPLAVNVGVAGRTGDYYKNEHVRPWGGIIKMDFAYA
jgi:hypothetical protein